MNFLNQLEFSLSGNFNSNDVLGKVKMFDQIASMTEEAKQEAIKKRMDYERRRSVFEKRKISSSSSTMQSTLLVLVNFCPVLSELLTWSFVYKNLWYFVEKLSMKIKSWLNFYTFQS